ncbi:unnamed protein product [Closterium sp. NIES-54]
MDVWGPARVTGQGCERYFLLVVDDCTRYTTVFPLRSKGEVFSVLIPWIRTVHLQLHERFDQDLPVLRLHSDRGGEFSSDLLRDFCRGEGITQSLTLPNFPQQNGIAERRIGLVMEVARTSMFHAAAPYFLWPFAVRYGAHQLNLWPRVSLPETSSTLRWTGKVGDASVFRVWGSCALLRDTSVDKLSARAIPCDVTFDDLVPFYRLFPYRSAPLPPPPLFLAPSPPAVDPLPPQGPAPSGVSQVDPIFGTGAAGVGGAGAGVAGVGGPGAGGAGAARVGVGGTSAGGAGAVLCVPSSTGLPPPFLCPPHDQSQPPLQPASPLPVPSPYTEQSGGLTERREPASRPILPVRTTRRAPRLRPPPVPGTHTMALPRAARPTVARLLATAFTDPSLDSADASALVAELLGFAAACRLDNASALVAESVPSSPPSVRAAVPHFSSLLLAPEGDPDAPDILTPRSYAEAIMGLYSSQWQAAMDAEMASWKSTSTYVDEIPPPGANIVDGMWIFRVKRPPGSPPAFKARYIARGLSQRQGVDYFQTFSPTPKMTTLRWHNTLRTPLAALGFVPSTADPSLFLRTNTSLPPFYLLVYVDDLVFATADTEALTLVKSELQKRHTCTDLGELRSYLGLQITRDRARHTITLTQSHMVHQVLQRFGFEYSSPQLTPLSTSRLLSTPPLDESVEPSGPYPELVGCLMYLMTCTRPDLANPLSLQARYVALGRHRKVHWDAVMRVLRYLCNTSGMGFALGGQGPVVLTGHADASWVDDSAT